MIFNVHQFKIKLFKFLGIKKISSLENYVIPIKILQFNDEKESPTHLKLFEDKSELLGQITSKIDKIKSNHLHEDAKSSALKVTFLNEAKPENWLDQSEETDKPVLESKDLTFNYIDQDNEPYISNKNVQRPAKLPYWLYKDSAPLNVMPKERIQKRETNKNQITLLDDIKLIDKTPDYTQSNFAMREMRSPSNRGVLDNVTSVISQNMPPWLRDAIQNADANMVLGTYQAMVMPMRATANATGALIRPIIEGISGLTG